MRIGVRTGGGWVSMGLLGWLILGPFIAIGYGLVIAAVVAYCLLRALVLAGIRLAR